MWFVMSDEIGIDDLSVEDLKELIEESGSNLVSLTPQEAIEEFIAHKKEEVQKATVEEYERELEYFKQYCQLHEIEDCSELNGLELDRYRRWRRDESTEGSLAPKTMRDEMYMLSSFIEYLEQIDAVEVSLHKDITIPSLGPDEGIRDVELAPDRVDRILEHLERYEYATREHVVWCYHAHTGRRPGSLYALDVEDVQVEGGDPVVKLRHREETPLKNDESSEIELGLSSEVATVFEDYLEHHRIDVTTDAGRKPFLTSRNGQLSKSTMRTYIYRYSRPCVIGQECPHDRDDASCEAAQSRDAASKCPSSRPPYALRHGYISAKRREGVPIETLGDHCDASPAVIERHYDERSETEKRKLRQKVMREFGADQEVGY
jgi:integrase